MYGMETFSQLALPDVGRLTVASATIEDQPEYVHRGFMIDTGRRFWPVSTVQKTIDALSYVKSNVLHFHMSDFCRFSVESKLYPNLTDALVGQLAGHYSQEDLQGLVQYAGDRGVRLMLEMDIPGHSKGFDPIMGEEGMQFCDPAPKGYGTQLYDDPQGRTTSILRNITKEMAGLVPEQLMHLGCDETQVTGPCTLENTAQLEKDAFRHVTADLGRTPVAWEEALFETNSAPPNAVINAWSRHTAAEVIARGHRAIESHSGWFYLNHATLPWTTLWRDIATGVASENKSMLLGGETSMWTDDFCYIEQCGAFGPGHSPPPGSPLFGPEQDAAFEQVVLSIVFPRALIGAGAFYGYDPSVNISSPEFDIVFRAAQERQAARGVPTCPPGCTCDYEQVCGHYLIPCDAAAPGTNVKLFTCAAQDDSRAKAQDFVLDSASNRIRPASNSSLCFGLDGKDPSSGQPNVALVACDPSDDSQSFKFDSGSGNIVHVQDGKCVDLTGGGSTPGTNAEIYQCGDKQDNQVFSVDPKTGHISNRGMCLDTCVYA